MWWVVGWVGLVGWGQKGSDGDGGDERGRGDEGLGGSMKRRMLLLMDDIMRDRERASERLDLLLSSTSFHISLTFRSWISGAAGSKRPILWSFL